VCLVCFSDHPSHFAGPVNQPTDPAAHHFSSSSLHLPISPFLHIATLLSIHSAVLRRGNGEMKLEGEFDGWEVSSLTSIIA
jgi:hypothetical protein